MSWSDKFGEPTEAELSVIRSVECIERNDQLYFRIDPENIDLSKMVQVQKGTDVVAMQVIHGEVKVTSRYNDEDYTVTRTASNGDYIVFNIGASDHQELIDKITDCEHKVLSQEEFEHLYTLSGSELELSSVEMDMLIASLKADNIDNPNLNRSFFRDHKRHAYIGKMVYAAMVNFNFVLRAPWGEDQYIKKGGIVIYNPHSAKNKGKDIYALGGVKEGKPGQFEKTYKLSSAEGKERGLISDSFKTLIKCDRSPVVGIQFNNIQVAEAFDKIGKAVPAALKKYLDPNHAKDPKNRPKHERSNSHKERYKESKNNATLEKGLPS